ncbi:mechanosensitive ion channel [Verrucomicrobiaceae bacterium R5-34]|nr:mechanosensitive ion channel [Verrucomicrobiaceae bacterium R5-34]
MSEAQEVIMKSLTSIWQGTLERVPFLVGAVFVLILTWFVASMVSKVMNSTLGKFSCRDSLVQLLARLAKTGVWIIGIVAAAMVVFPGLTPSKALGAAGLVSVAVGLAFKDIFQNFFAGVMLLWKFPFEEGDMIECGDIAGRVKSIELRHTQIRDTSGELIIMPNSKLVTEPVEVLTYDKLRRVEMTVGVSYDTDVAEAQSVILKTVEGLERLDHNQPVKVLPTEFGSSSIDFEVLFWAGSSPMQQREAKAEAVLKIKKALDDAGIEIPFPYRTLTFKEPLTTQPYQSCNTDEETEELCNDVA